MTRGMHCLSSLVGRINGWARLLRSGRLLRIGVREVGEHGRNFWVTDESNLFSTAFTRALNCFNS